MYSAEPANGSGNSRTRNSGLGAVVELAENVTPALSMASAVSFGIGKANTAASL